MEETKEASNAKFCLLDSDFLIFTVVHCKKLENGEVEVKSLEDCKYLLDKFIEDICTKVNATHCILAVTNKRCFRYKLWDGYKANRKYPEPPLHFEETRDYLLSKPNIIKDTDLEGDDIIVCFKSYLAGLEIDSILVSPDKDVVLCQKGYHYNPRKGEFVTISSKEAARNFWISMVVGDSVDGIKGVPGKGKVFAEKLFEDGVETNVYPYRTLVTYTQHFGEDEGIEQFYLNYKMLHLVDKPAYGFNPADYELDTFKI